MIGEVFRLDQSGAATIYLGRQLGNVVIRSVHIEYGAGSKAAV